VRHVSLVVVIVIIIHGDCVIAVYVCTHPAGHEAVLH